MKKISWIIYILLLAAQHLLAQGRPSAPSMPDINKMMKMSPAELENYKKKMLDDLSKKARSTAEAAKVKIDETQLPDYEVKAPSRDEQHLAALPFQPPTRQELMAGVQQSIRLIESVMPAPGREEANRIVAQQNAGQLQGSSVAMWYTDRPAEALLLSMHAARKSPDSVIAWNNLAAFYNMAGMPYKAIPILMYQLTVMPGNSMLLNNMGQAYLGLGALDKASDYLQQCLTIDALNPEANRSMGMICLFNRNYDEAAGYFEKEMEVAYRPSSLAALKKKGIFINIYQARTKRTGIPHRNFFEEIELGKFIFPDLPDSSDGSTAAQEKASGWGESIIAEMLFWMNACKGHEAEQREEGRHDPGIFHNYVKELLADLHKVYTPGLLSIFRKEDLHHLASMIDNYHQQLGEVHCATAPAGSHIDVDLAYQKKCCEAKKPLTDAFMAKYNAFVTAKVQANIGRWKQYINALINIVSLDPNTGNKILVYKTVQDYFSMLGIGWQAGQFLDPPMECHIAMSSAQADSVIASSHNIDLHCTSWLNIQYDIWLAKIKADCSKFAIEGGEVYQGAFEHNFKTGTSTLAVGVGIKAKFFAKVGSANIKQMVYVSWDDNNHFTDFGLKGSASVNIGDTPIEVAGGIAKVGGVLAGVEGGYTLGVNSGFNSSVKGKGILSEFVKIDKPLP